MKISRALSICREHRAPLPLMARAGGVGEVLHHFHVAHLVKGAVRVHLDP